MENKMSAGGFKLYTLPLPKKSRLSGIIVRDYVPRSSTYSQGRRPPTYLFHLHPIQKEFHPEWQIPEREMRKVLFFYTV